jgi:hypothetical protein
MKKISFVSAIALAAASLVGIAPSQAAQADTIAIIDTQFDGANVGNNVTHQCVTACSNTSVPQPPTAEPGTRKHRTELNNYNTQLRHYNHGIGIAEIVRKSNPNAHLILIRAGSTKVGEVTSQGLLAAFRWVEQNGSRHSIDVVSVSLNAGNASRCTSIGGVKHSDVVNSVNSILSSGSVIVAAAGNGSNVNQLAYPACIPNVVAVSINGSRDGVNNPSTDFIGRSDGFNFNTTIGPINWGSSSALTAMVSAAWGTIEHIPNTRQRITLNVVN